jgi:hypothetical protein
MQKPNIPKCACEWTINVRENRMSNHEWTIQRNWQHWVHKTQDENKRNKKTQYNMSWTPILAKKHK